MKCPIFCDKIFVSAKLTIRLGHHRLDSCNDHSGLGNNLFLFCLVDVPCQRRDKQGGQNSQDDQNDNQLNKRKAFVFVLHFIYRAFLILLQRNLRCRMLFY